MSETFNLYTASIAVMISLYTISLDEALANFDNLLSHSLAVLVN